MKKIREILKNLVGSKIFIVLISMLATHTLHLHMSNLNQKAALSNIYLEHNLEKTTREQLAINDSIRNKIVKLKILKDNYYTLLNNYQISLPTTKASLIAKQKKKLRSTLNDYNHLLREIKNLIPTKYQHHIENFLSYNEGEYLSVVGIRNGSPFANTDALISQLRSSPNANYLRRKIDKSLVNIFLEQIFSRYVWVNQGKEIFYLSKNSQILFLESILGTAEKKEYNDYTQALKSFTISSSAQISDLLPINKTNFLLMKKSINLANDEISFRNEYLERELNHTERWALSKKAAFDHILSGPFASFVSIP